MHPEDESQYAGSKAPHGPVRVVLASANPDKAREIAVIFATSVPEGTYELVARPEGIPDVEETGSTLEENARLKAQALLLATGDAAMSDDTGLEVDALDGAPGVWSARFAGEGATYADNVAKLLDVLRDRLGPTERSGHDSAVESAGGPGGASDRCARFRTVALMALPDGTEVVAEGVVDGMISDSPRGDAGFGYDPVFVPTDGDGRTFAEMTAEEKDAISHRGRAFRALAAQLAHRYGT